MTIDHRPRHRPDHPARGVPPPARRGARELPARVGRAGPARAATRSSARGSRLVSLRGGRARRGEPVVGYLALRPRREARADRAAAGRTGRGLPESRFVVADTLVRFDHVRGRRRGARAATADEVARAARGRTCRGRRASASAASTTRRASRARTTTSAASSPAKEHIRAGDAFQIVLSQRAERPTAASALALYRALRRVNPSPYLFLLELGRPRARRLVAGDARQARGHARERSTRSPARRSPARATPSGCSPPRRTAPST